MTNPQLFIIFKSHFILVNTTFWSGGLLRNAAVSYSGFTNIVLLCPCMSSWHFYCGCPIHMVQLCPYFENMSQTDTFSKEHQGCKTLEFPQFIRSPVKAAWVYFNIERWFMKTYGWIPRSVHHYAGDCSAKTLTTRASVQESACNMGQR